MVKKQFAATNCTLKNKSIEKIEVLYITSIIRITLIGYKYNILFRSLYLLYIFSKKERRIKMENKIARNRKSPANEEMYIQEYLKRNPAAKKN